MANQQTNGKTTAKHPTTQIKTSYKHDYITVVGASYMSVTEHVREYLGKEARGNKMRFVNQGIRQIRLYPETTKNASIQRIFLIFVEEYPRPLLDKIKSVVEGRYRASYRELNNISQFVDFINDRSQKKRVVRQLDIFSHGVTGSIEFGYALSKQDCYRFCAVQANTLKQDSFEYDAKLYSYACRTGLGINAEHSINKDEDPCYDKSLAQLTADAADVEVWAFPRKSNYDQTYGTAEERKKGEANIGKVREYDSAYKKYKTDIASYQSRLMAYQKKYPAAKQLPSESSPSQPQKTFTDDDERLARHQLSLKRNIKDIGHPLDEEGAVQPVRSGDEPAGLPPGLRKYTPKAWGKK